MRLKGVHRVKKRLADGTVTHYHYAWRGGPRLHAEPGTPEFIREFEAAFAERSAPANGTINALITEYKQSAEFQNLSTATRREYLKYLDMIGDKFGTAKFAAFEDKRIRKHIRSWRDGMSSKPRKADYALAVLRALLTFGMENGDIAANHARGFHRLHSADRSDIIWEPEDIEKFCAVASPALQRAFHIARLTGLRREDLVKIPWTADKGSYLEWKTGKGRRYNRTVIIPIVPALRTVMGPKASNGAMQIVMGDKGRPLSPSGLSTAVDRAKRKAGVDKRWHDLRGNAATALCIAGLDDREVAEIVGWTEDDVAKIRRKYVSRERIIQAAIHRLDRNKPGDPR